MQYINKYLKKISLFLTTENGLRILALIMAVFLFIAISGGNILWGDLFLTSKIIEDVPLTADYDNENYVVENLPETVDVKVTGTPSNVEAAISKAETISSEVTIPTNTTGEYEIKSSDIKISSITGVDLEVGVESIVVSVQEKVEKIFPINVIFHNGEEMGGGVILGDAILSTNNVDITGGLDTVGNISYVNANVDLSTLEINDTGEGKITAPLVAYDNQGKIVNELEMDVNEVDVTQSYEYNTVEKPIKYEFINNNTGKYIESVCSIELQKECNEALETNTDYTEFTDLYGEQAAIEEINDVVYQVDMSDYSEGSVSLTATPILPNNVYNLESEREVKISLGDGVTKSFTGLNIQTQGLNENYSIEVNQNNSAVVNGEVTGAQSIVNKLTKDDIIVYIDVSECTLNDVCDVPILYNVDSNVTMKLGTERIEVILKEKELSEE